MQNRIYFDTNIIIDICDETRKRSKNSQDVIFSLLQNEDNELYINSDTLSTLFYILNNKTKMSLNKSIELIENMNGLFSIVSVATQDVKFACGLCKEKKFDDYEDALQYVCAKKISANTIFTNDKGFSKLDIDIKKTYNN